jgi:septin family protein
LGKSTLIQTLFSQEESDEQGYAPLENLPASKRIEKTVQIAPHVLRLTEHAVSLTLTVIDTPGCHDCIHAIEQFS